MSNDYYTYGNTFIPGDLARAEDVASEFQAAQAGFGLLPTPRSDGRGFTSTFKVMPAAEPEHPVQLSQVASLLQDSQTVEEAAQIASSVIAIANYKGVWSTLTGPLDIPASVSHDGVTWILTQNLADVTSDEPGVSNKWQKALALNRYDLLSEVTTSILDLEKSNVFRIEASSDRDILFGSTPEADRAMVVVVHLSDASLSSRTITWPTSIYWAGGVAPTLNGTKATVTLFWTGAEWVGSLGVLS